MNAITRVSPRLLVIEDDVVLGDHLRACLSDRKFRIHLCTDGDAGLLEAASGQYDLVLLDILLPGLNGLELLATLRKTCSVPVIVISALGDEEARIEGLIGGADDYVPKPFSMAELGVRIDAVLRRVALERQVHKVLESSGGLVLHDGEQQACYNNVDLALTTTEFRLLQVLLENKDQILSKPFLYQTVLHRGCGRHDRSLDLHVSHLRRKLRDGGIPESPVRTVWGQGYTLVTDFL
ncbi:MAG: response regulator transcription factor [Alcanivorax nanhaiticus]